MGHPDAKAEFWQAMTDGLYQIMNEAEELARTLGYDLDTVPFLISELESQCCRISTAMAGKADMKMRSKAAKPPALDPTVMKPVTGVGAP